MSYSATTTDPSVIPNALKYRSTKPYGFPNAIKEVTFTPVNTYNSWVPGEPIRWEIKSNGFLDPHTTRLSFDVTVDDLSPDEIRRLDGSAHSFFSELTIWVRGVYIENIREYDVLSNILHDLNWNPSDRIIKAHEGHGISDLSYGEFSHRYFDGDYFSRGRAGQYTQKLSYDPTEAYHAHGVAPELHSLVLNTNYITNSTYWDGLVAYIHTAVGSTSPWNGNYTTHSPESAIVYYMLLRSGITSGGIHNNAYSDYYLAFHLNTTTAFPTTVSGNVNLTPCTFYKNSPNFCYPSVSYLRSDFCPGYSKPITYSINDCVFMIKEGSALPAYMDGIAANGLRRWPSLHSILTTQNTTTAREAAMIVYGSFMYYNYRRGTLYEYLVSGYYKTNPWTFNRTDYHEVFENPPDYSSVSKYNERVDKKWLVEAGRGKTLVEYADDGYKQPYNSIYCSGLDEVFFAGTEIPIKRMLKGKIASENGRKFLSFSVPLLSAIFGVLLPSELYKLIPMNIMEDLVIELKLNNYALFSSGYKSQIFTGNDLYNEIIDVSGYGPLRYYYYYNTRLYRITKMEMIADILSFTPAIENLVSTQYQNEGIFIQTQGFVLGPQTQYATTYYVAGTHYLNYSFNSIKSIFWRYMPMDYEKYSFCRKYFALSHNVTNIKLQLGQDFLPIDGIRGNGGTPFGTENDRYGSNKEFYNQMLMAFNKLHMMSGNMTINPYNFAVNDRCYDPTAKGSYYTLANIFDNSYLDVRTRAAFPTASYLGTTNSNQIDHAYLSTSNFELVVQNPHTALQLPGFHETRLKGRCLYAVDTESLRTDWGFISGLNTYDFKPFNFVIEVDTDTTRHFKRDSRIWMYFHYDTIIQFKSGMAPVVYGKS